MERGAGGGFRGKFLVAVVMVGFFLFAVFGGFFFLFPNPCYLLRQFQLSSSWLIHASNPPPPNLATLARKGKNKHTTFYFPFPIPQLQSHHLFPPRPPFFLPPPPTIHQRNPPLPPSLCTASTPGGHLSFPPTPFSGLLRFRLGRPGLCGPFSRSRS